MELTWYTYFSWWIFIWFLVFKMGLTKLSPYLIYCGVVIFIILKLTRDIVHLTFYDEKKIKNYDLIIVWIVFILLLDIMPFFYLKKQIDKESIFFTLFLGLTYCLMMNIWKINILNHYAVINYREISDKFTTKNFFKKIFQL
jgi:hypothetical protein